MVKVLSNGFILEQLAYFSTTALVTKGLFDLAFPRSVEIVLVKMYYDSSCRKPTHVGFIKGVYWLIEQKVWRYLALQELLVSGLKSEHGNTLCPIPRGPVILYGMYQTVQSSWSSVPWVPIFVLLSLTSPWQPPFIAV